MFKKITAVVGIATLLMSFALIGCNGSGGNSLLGGGAANHPIANGTVQAWVGNAWKNISTTDANGNINPFDPALLGSSYPVVMRIAPNSGTIKGYTGATATYKGELKTVVAEGAQSVYFSLLTTLVTGIYESTKAQYATDAEALEAAKGFVNGLISMFGVKFDCLTENPLESLGSAMVQAALWKGFGLNVNNPADSAQVDSMVSGMGAQVAAGNAPVTVLQNSLPQLGAQITAAVATGKTPAQGLQNFVNVVMTDTDVLAGLAKSYDNPAFGGNDPTQVKAKLAALGANVTTAAANTIGLFAVTNASTSDSANTAVSKTSCSLLAANAGGATLTWTIKTTDALGQQLALAEKMTATLDNAKIGAFADGNQTTKIAPTNALGQPSVYTVPLTLAADLSELAGTEFTVTFELTRGTGDAKVTRKVSVKGVVRGAGDFPANINVSTTESSRLLLFNASNQYTDSTTYNLTANVSKLGGGAFTAGDFKVNFLAPTGTQFVVGGSKYTNYMVALSATGLATHPVQFAGSDKSADGPVGAVGAEVIDAKSGKKVEPKVFGQVAGPFWVHAGAAISDVRRIELLYGDRTNSYTYDTSVSGALPQALDLSVSSATTSGLMLQFVTWEGDTQIDTYSVNDNTGAVRSAFQNKFYKACSDAKAGAGFKATATTYDNVPLGNIQNGLTNNAGNVVVQLQNSNFQRIADDKAFSGYRLDSKGTHDDNVDMLSVQVFQDSSYKTLNRSSSISTIVIK